MEILEVKNNRNFKITEINSIAACKYQRKESVKLKMNKQKSSDLEKKKIQSEQQRGKKLKNKNKE